MPQKVGQTAEGKKKETTRATQLTEKKEGSDGRRSEYNWNVNHHLHHTQGVCRRKGMMLPSSAYSNRRPCRMIRLSVRSGSGRRGRTYVDSEVKDHDDALPQRPVELFDERQIVRPMRRLGSQHSFVQVTHRSQQLLR